jgi:hypothetical protein
MRLVTVQRSAAQTTIVNVDQIAYLSHDIYGTKIFFASGDSIVCAEDIDALSERLSGGAEPERLLIEPRR